MNIMREAPMGTRRVVVLDGYNVIHRVPELARHMESSLEAARNALIAICAEWLATRRDVSRFFVVFDGDSAVPGNMSSPHSGIQVLFTPTGETADERILRVVEVCGDQRRYLVVSDDNYVTRLSGRLDARVMSVSQFFRTVRGTRRRRAVRSDFAPARGLTPIEQARINRELERRWGLEGGRE